MNVPKNYISQEDAVTRLGISKAEANALDELDGKSGNGIRKDVFTEAQEALKSLQSLDVDEASEEDVKKAFLKIANLSGAAKAIARTIASKLGLDIYLINKNSTMNEEEMIEEFTSLSEIGGDISQFQDEILEYYTNKGSLEGFKFSKLPQGIRNIKINIDEVYDKQDNDQAILDSNGNATVKQVIDGILVEIHYTKNDQEFVFGEIHRDE